MGQNSSTHLLVGVDFHRTVSIVQIANLGVALEDNLNNLFLASGQDVSILRIDNGLGVGLISVGLRNLNNRSAAEDLDVTSLMDSINVIIVVSVGSNGISAHRANKLGSSEDDSIAAICLYSAY